jgi:hypothetical protein
MKEVRIEIENTKLAELGVEQPIKYAPFRFNESQFIGYWVSENEETGIKTIIFYTNGQTFNCKYCEKNINIFESILNSNVNQFNLK